MGRVEATLKAIITMGNRPQEFIGAKWLIQLLELCPPSRKRSLALRILALSPHYFYRHADPAYAGMSHPQFLEAEVVRNRSSREKLYRFVLAPHLKAGDVAVDYGCGPGWLARVVSKHVGKVYAVDISRGVLACARVINPANNLEYVAADEGGLAQLPDAGVDVVYSFAVVQHVTDEVMRSILRTCAQVLKPAGRLVVQVQLEGSPGWKSEDEWRADTSPVGKLKLRYGLHCFSRTEDSYRRALREAGFRVGSVEPISSLVPEHFDDVCRQHLVIATKV